MGYRVDARDVMDDNTDVVRSFEAKIVGHFRHAGPNRWDPYELVADDGPDVQVIEVLAGLRVQHAPPSLIVRTRRAGTIVEAEWLPPAELADRPRSELAALFAERHLSSAPNVAGVGAAAIIAKRLTDA